MSDDIGNHRDHHGDFIPRQQHNRTVFALVAVCCLSIGIAIGAITRGIAGAKSDDNRISISEGTPSADELSAAFSRVARRVEPSVVHIGVTDDRSGGLLTNEGGTGSGIIVNPSGFILTNQHVIEGSSKITVKLFDGQEYPAKIVGQDSDTDLAVIKIDAQRTLPTARMGDSGKLAVGEWVLAIGSPFGLDQTVTAGIISAKDRVTDRSARHPFQQFLQTDAAINPGNSGGPLVNLSGEVIGINTLIATSSGVYSGIGFALPSSTAVDTYNQLIAYGRVRRGFLGVTLQPLTVQVARRNGLSGTAGVLVGDVTSADSPAAQAGIKSEDVIVAINGQKVADIRDLIRRVGTLPVGSMASVTFLRDGAPHTVSVKLDERQEPTPLGQQQTQPDPHHSLPLNRDDQHPELRHGYPDSLKEEPRGQEVKAPLGLLTQTLSIEKANALGMPGTKGALITEVQHGSVGWENGLQARDVIIEIDRKPIADEGDFNHYVGQLKSGDDVIIRVLRRNGLGQTPPVTSFIASFTIP